jgi:hypothetical protein
MARSDLGDVLVALAETDPRSGTVNTVSARFVSCHWSGDSRRLAASARSSPLTAPPCSMPWRALIIGESSCATAISERFSRLLSGA